MLPENALRIFQQNRRRNQEIENLAEKRVSEGNKLFPNAFQKLDWRKFDSAAALMKQASDLSARREFRVMSQLGIKQQIKA